MPAYTLNPHTQAGAVKTLSIFLPYVLGRCILASHAHLSQIMPPGTQTAVYVVQVP